VQHSSGDESTSGWKMWLWMAACCVPMVAIAFLIIWGFWTSS
jgi:nitrate reductase NapE component